MREQLIQYVNLLFAGAPDSEEIKLEILQNTLDRYDDLVSQGKSPEAAYRLAISGIGDINEILGSNLQQTTFAGQQYHSPAPAAAEDNDSPTKKLLRACAIGLYILCPVPLFVLADMGMDSIGLCGTLALVAVATVLIILGKKRSDTQPKQEEAVLTPQQELQKAVKSIIGVAGLVIYLLLSFATNAWYITWLIFPVMGCVQGLVKAIMDLKEANKYEN